MVFIAAFDAYKPVMRSVTAHSFVKNMFRGAGIATHRAISIAIVLKAMVCIAVLFFTAKAGVPMACLVGGPIGCIIVLVTQGGSEDIATDGAGLSMVISCFLSWSMGC